MEVYTYVQNIQEIITHSLIITYTQGSMLIATQKMPFSQELWNIWNGPYQF